MRHGRRRLRWLATATILGAAAAVSARAGSASDAEAGLRALDGGAYQRAVRLFTKAIDAGDLSKDNRELAYLDRGRAYAGEGDSAHALADFKEAVRLKPDDTEALAALRQAGGDAAPDDSDVQATADPWGLLGKLAGHLYWYPIKGQDSRAAYVSYTWASPGKILSMIIHLRSGLGPIEEWALDEETNRIETAMAYGSTGVLYGTAVARGNDLYQYIYSNNTPVKEVIHPQPDGSLVLTETEFIDGHWQQTYATPLPETSRDELGAQGFKNIP